MNRMYLLETERRLLADMGKENPWILLFRLRCTTHSFFRSDDHGSNPGQIRRVESQVESMTGSISDALALFIVRTLTHQLYTLSHKSNIHHQHHSHKQKESPRARLVRL